MIFRDRRDAGKPLAARLRRYADRSDVLVLALPRGGVPVATPCRVDCALSKDVVLEEHYAEDIIKCG